MNGCWLLAAATDSSSAWAELGSKLSGTEGRAIIGWALAVLALWLIGPNSSLSRKIAGAIFGVLGLGVFWSFVPAMSFLPAESVFLLLAGLTIFSAVATISARSPVYSAIWFACSLLGTAGLFLFQGAQFLGIATIAVYAGAIVVTFLFVLMLAQPEGHAFFDRVSWGKSPRAVIPVVTMAIVSLIAYQFGKSDIRNHVKAEELVNQTVAELAGPDAAVRKVVHHQDGDVTVVEVDVVANEEALSKLEDSKSELQRSIGERIPDWSKCVVDFHAGTDVRTADHVAHLGGQLFGANLIGVEVAGCLLMMALVGALVVAGLDEEKKPGATAR